MTELVVSCSHELPGSDEAFVIPLRGLPRIDRLDVQVQLAERPAAADASNLGGSVRERRVISLVKRSWSADADFEIRQAELAARQGLRHGHLALVRLAAPVEGELQEIDSLYVLVDSSASRALGFERQISRVRRLLSGLCEGADPLTPVALAPFDQTVHPIFAGTAGELEGRALRAAVRDLGERGVAEQAVAEAIVVESARPGARSQPRTDGLGHGPAAGR